MTLPPRDPSPGVAVAIVYRSSAGRRKCIVGPAPWPENDRMSLPCLASPTGWYSEYWPVTAYSVMLFGLRKSHGERALCVPLEP